MGLIRRVPLPVELDFARPRRRASRTGWIFLVMAVFVGAFQLAAYRDQSREMDEIEARFAAAREEARRASGRSEAVAAPVGADEVKGALDVGARLNADWGQVLSGVAASQGDAVSWVSLQVEQGRSIVNINGYARTLGDMFEFVARLGRTPGLREARLANYEWTRVANQDAVRFTVSAKWSIRR